MKVNLDRYNLFFKKDIIDIYHSWININKPLYIKYYNLIGLMIMSMLIPLDYILYENNYIFFTQFRIIYISIILLNLLYIQINQKRLFEKKTGNYSFCLQKKKNARIPIKRARMKSFHFFEI